jgi:hypothetical protein
MGVDDYEKARVRRNDAVHTLQEVRRAWERKQALAEAGEAASVPDPGALPPSSLANSTAWLRFKAAQKQKLARAMEVWDLPQEKVAELAAARVREETRAAA